MASKRLKKLTKVDKRCSFPSCPIGGSTILRTNQHLQRGDLFFISQLHVFFNTQKYTKTHHWQSFTLFCNFAFNTAPSHTQRNSLLLNLTLLHSLPLLSSILAVMKTGRRRWPPTFPWNPPSGTGCQPAKMRSCEKPPFKIIRNSRQAVDDIHYSAKRGDFLVLLPKSHIVIFDKFLQKYLVYLTIF